MLNRLKQFIESKGLTIAAVERALGMSNGALAKPIKNHTAIGSDKIENILSFWPELSVTWLFTGHGEMVKHTGKTENQDPATNAIHIEKKILENMLIEKDTTIVEQAKEIGRLEQRITELEQRLEKTVGNVNIEDTANVG